MAKSLVEKVLRVIAHQIEFDYGKLDWDKLTKKYNVDFETWVFNGCLSDKLEKWRLVELYNRMKGIYDIWKGYW